MNNIQIAKTNSITGNTTEVIVVLASDANASSITSTEQAVQMPIAAILDRQGFDYQGDSAFYIPCIAPISDSHKGVLVVPFPQVHNNADSNFALEIADRIRAACALVHEHSRTSKCERIAIVSEVLPKSSFILLASQLQSKQSLGECTTSAEHQLTEILYYGDSIGSDLLIEAKALSDGLDLAKQIILLPPNLKRPVILGEKLRVLFSAQENFSVEVFNQSELEQLGCGGIVGVGKAGSPVLCKVTYTPDAFTETKALVLKGVTMDTGGYGVKPAMSQEDWKGDCAGAATGLGALLALGTLKPSCRIIAYVPLVENLISENALLFGEVLTMANGKTVEVGHTDAEGRLILADALVLAGKDATTIIDMATLTGVCATVLGKKIAGLFSNSDELAASLIDAGKKVGERYHRFPFEPKLYGGMLKGRVADLRNLNASGPDLLLTACFLSNFVPDGVKWAHIDFAGPALDGIDQGHVNAFGVLTLVQLLDDRSTF
jgi:leucyl aminopeptidase